MQDVSVEEVVARVQADPVLRLPCALFLLCAMHAGEDAPRVARALTAAAQHAHAASSGADLLQRVFAPTATLLAAPSEISGLYAGRLDIASLIADVALGTRSLVARVRSGDERASSASELLRTLTSFATSVMKAAGPSAATQSVLEQWLAKLSALADALSQDLERPS